MKLYQLLLGCKPAGRNIEQHDVFFGVGNSLKDLIPEILNFWPEANGKIHIDAWREVTHVEGFHVQVAERSLASQPVAMFFLNLGGYKADEFSELHYQMLLIGKDKAEVTGRAKDSAFFKHTGFEGAPSHIDDKYGVDVDDIFEIDDVLPAGFKDQFSILISRSEGQVEDEIHLGYLPLQKL
ncbi:DUF1543 domain-containing protein [Pedobacter cryoconitis]|uniref:DUF1543 domain-containing protein n=1 Tax=Pedobacter cryoconitis TaxID=188932 RepID=A0A7X0J274_9SPHI|nr:DUF1543 domain-containing protein [Pedobacter cryoconitis]MBB6499739.1 hypothetical protein [Pedobacter cryoconitis]